MKRNALASLVGISMITALAATWPFGLGAGPAPAIAAPQTAATCFIDHVSAPMAVKHTLTRERANRVLAAAIAWNIVG